MADLCVAHLVRARNGIAPFERFLSSYRANPGGVDHELLLVFKGFSGDGGLDAYRALLDGVPHASIRVPDEGFDIGSYFRVAEEHESSSFCFLNSFSRLLVGGWLATMVGHLERPGVGAVGATGSWESHTTNIARAGADGLPVLGAIRAKLWTARFGRFYAPFPNPHVRTNGFLVARQTMLRLRRSEMRRKSEAHRFESGRDGMSHQVLGMGLRLVLVGRDGSGYETDEWHRSGTFRQGRQENLLIADNQTDAYANGSPELRAMLGRCSWADAGSDS